MLSDENNFYVWFLRDGGICDDTINFFFHSMGYKASSHGQLAYKWLVLAPFKDCLLFSFELVVWLATQSLVLEERVYLVVESFELFCRWFVAEDVRLDRHREDIFELRVIEATCRSSIASNAAWRLDLKVMLSLDLLCLH